MSEKTLTRAQLGEAIYEEVGLSRIESGDLLESVLSEMSSAEPKRAISRISKHFKKGGSSGLG